MKKIFLFLFVAILLLSVVGCTKTTQTTVMTSPTTTSPTIKPVSFQVAKSDKPRVTSPNVSDTQLSALVSGNSNFAFDLYQQLIKNNTGNMFYSP